MFNNTFYKLKNHISKLYNLQIILKSRLECNITGYVLTLMFNKSGNQITDTQEILSSSDSSHFIDNLLPGFQYNIKLTPMSVKGPLPSSPMYSITTLTQSKYLIITIKL